MVKLGDEVKDEVSGFQGIAVARTEYLNGCVQFEVQPKVNEKMELPDSCFIDEQQLQIIEKNNKEDPEEAGGGVRNHPPKR